MEFLLMRYANRPNPEVSAKLAEYVKPNTRPYFTTLPGVMITSFVSEENIEIIRAGLATLNIKFDLVEKPAVEASTNAAPRTTGAPAANTAGTGTVDMTSIPALKAAIRAALGREDYEKAAEYRDALDALEGRTPPTTERRLITSILEFRKAFDRKK